MNEAPKPGPEQELSPQQLLKMLLESGEFVCVNSTYDQEEENGTVEVDSADMGA